MIYMKKVMKIKTTALFASVEKENVKIVKFLLSFPNIDVNAFPMNKHSALHLAVEKGNIEIVKLLLTKEDIDVNKYCIYELDRNGVYLERKEKKTPLYLAVEKENIEIVKLLISHPNIDINANCIYEHEIYDNEININEINNKIMTMLHFAVDKKNIELIKLLLSNPNIDIDNKYISTKKLYDYSTKNEKIIEETKITALQFTIEHKNKEIIKLFLDCKKYISNQF